MQTMNDAQRNKGKRKDIGRYVEWISERKKAFTEESLIHTIMLIYLDAATKYN